jgi:hypothetical protein
MASLVLVDPERLAELLSEHLVEPNVERIKSTQSVAIGTLKLKSNQRWVAAVRSQWGAVDRAPCVPKVREALLASLRAADCLPSAVPPEWLHEQAARIQRLLVRGRRVGHATRQAVPQVEHPSDEALSSSEASEAVPSDSEAFPSDSEAPFK